MGGVVVAVIDKPSPTESDQYLAQDFLKLLWPISVSMNENPSCCCLSQQQFAILMSGSKYDICTVPLMMKLTPSNRSSEHWIVERPVRTNEKKKQKKASIDFPLADLND